MKEVIDASILEDKAKRPRPLLVCVARDVPMVGKQKLLHQVLTDLEGMFVRVSLSENQGVDVNAFQMALDAGSSIIADVDVGVSASSRSTFLHSIAIAKKALVPNPMCIVIVANPDNRKGTGAEVHLGAAEADLRVMRDGDMKRRLQMSSHSLKVSERSEAKRKTEKPKSEGESETNTNHISTSPHFPTLPHTSPHFPTLSHFHTSLARSAYADSPFSRRERRDDRPIPHRRPPLPHARNSNGGGHCHPLPQQPLPAPRQERRERFVAR